MMFERMILRWFIFQALLALGVNADCYSHDGILAQDSKYYGGPELVSCGKGTNNCCLQDQKCGTNLLCTGTDGSLSRQYCADKGWSGCSNLCADVASAAGTMLTECADNVYCCGENCACTNNNLYFVDPETGEVKDASKGSSSESATWWSVDSSALLASTATSSPPPATSAQEVTSTSSTPEATSAAPSQPTSAASSQAHSDASSDSNPTASSNPANPSASGAGASSALASPQTTVTGPDSSSSAQSTSQPSSWHGLSAGAGAGIGVGCAAAVAGVAALAWLLIRERRKRRSLEAQQAHGPPSNYAGGHRAANLDEDAYKEVYTSGQQGLGYGSGPQGVSPPPGYGHSQVQEVEDTARYEMK